MLLLVEVNPILEEQDYKKDAFIAYGTSCIEIFFCIMSKSSSTLYTSIYSISWGS